MTSIKRDPLLAVARGILWFLMGLMALGLAACIIALPAVLIFQDHILVSLSSELPAAPGPEMIGAILLVLVCAIILLGLMFRIFQLLLRIVATVGEGDPFVPDNAGRLTQMAWLALGTQLIAIPLGAMGLWLDEVTEGSESSDLHIEGGIGFEGLLLVLILFILARVFRKGAEMRADLEGTV
jgi:hypothetical protein